MGEILIGVIAFAIIYGLFKLINNAAGDSLGKDKTCPYCGHKGLRKVGPSGFYVNGKLRTDWKCTQCGKTITLYS